MSSEAWYSDAALAKQAALEAGNTSLTNLFGILEPRREPTAVESCVHCGRDARLEAGGDGDWCSFCLGRGRDEDCSQQELEAMRAARIGEHA